MLLSGWRQGVSVNPRPLSADSYEVAREDHLAARVRYVSAAVALIALATGGLIVARGIDAFGGNPGGFVKFGTEGAAIPHDGSLGDVPLAPEAGHDGKFYFVQAHDPFLLQEQTVVLLHPPLYRAQRVLYPLLASPAALVNDRVLAWTMIGINLLALSVGAWATARLAVSLGGSPWLGLAFGLNIGLIFELIIDGAGIVAWALGVVGIWAAVEGRTGWAAVALSGAVLTREVMVLVAGGLFLGLLLVRRQRAWSVVAAPVSAAAVWALWIRLRAGRSPVGSELPAVGPPLQGLLRSIESWLSGYGDPLIGVTVLCLFLVVGWQLARWSRLISWSVVGFSILGMFLTEPVWTNGFDITRAAAPALTGFVLAAFTKASQPVLVTVDDRIGS